MRRMSAKAILLHVDAIRLIEDQATLCLKGKTWRCILMQQRGHTDGVLVIPEDGCYVG